MINGIHNDLFYCIKNNFIPQQKSLYSQIASFGFKNKASIHFWIDLTCILPKLRGMGKEMTLDVLSSIKGAKASKVVADLFEVIKKGHISENKINLSENNNTISIDDLRADIVIESSVTERNLIIENFPNKKNGFLVVPKVIEE